MSVTINRGFKGSNDDGSGTTGTVVNAAYIDAFCDAIDTSLAAVLPLAGGTLTGRLGSTPITSTSTGTQNDFAAPTSSVLLMNNASTATLTGITAGVSGQLLLILSKGAGSVVLNHADSGSSAANRFACSTGAAITLAAGSGAALLVYDGTASLWRVYQIGGGGGVAGATTTSTGNQDNFAPGLTFAAGQITTLRCNNASLLTIRGIAGGVDQAILEIVSVGAGQVDLKHQDTNSTAANRLINFATTGPTSLAAGVGTAQFVYDGTTSRWRLLDHEQGDWITPTYGAGNFTGNGSMTWTVDAGDVADYMYYLKGRELSVKIFLAATSVGGTPNTELRAACPGGYTIVDAIPAFCWIRNNSSTAAFSLTNISSGFIAFYTDLTGGANWAAATNTTYVSLNTSYQVQ